MPSYKIVTNENGSMNEILMQYRGLKGVTVYLLN